MFQDWSKRLDQLGWTKVLVDVREHVPSVSMLWSSSSSSSSSSLSANDDDDDDDESENSIRDVPLKENDSPKQVWTAHELLTTFGTGLLKESTPTTSGGGGGGGGSGSNNIGRLSSVLSSPPPLRIPLGHNVMIANAKDGLNRWLTRGGRPVMDWLSTSIVETLTARDPKPNE
jgi:hypothetical protein